MSARDPLLQRSVSRASEDASGEDHSQDSLRYKLVEPQGLCKGNVAHVVGTSSASAYHWQYDFNANRGR